MGRPKRTKDATPHAGDPAERTTIINLKGSFAYVAWLDGLYRKTHIPKASIIRLALAEWAERHGHELPPEI